RGRKSRCSRISAPYITRSLPRPTSLKKFFDWRIRLVYAFNHEEAITAFTEASRLDPDAPMPYWGVALSLGPNINAAMDPKVVSRAVEAVQKATARLSQATARASLRGSPCRSLLG
ncbi:MAG: hypothetical protein IPJ44_14960, partial [Nitrospira sp.]|nr:hypothetical protein [Nitrospira sp.]